RNDVQSRLQAGDRRRDRYGYDDPPQRSPGADVYGHSDPDRPPNVPSEQRRHGRRLVEPNRVGMRATPSGDREREDPSVNAGLAQSGDGLAGKYRVDKIRGVGGMGMVVAATHLELDQKVALKFMLPAALESNEASKRFLREARAAGSLNSPHICRVIDLGRLE